MSVYAPPLEEFEFVLGELADLKGVLQLPGCEEISAEVVTAILTEAGRFSADVLAPLNRVGDHEGSVLENGVVRTPTGFKEAYKAYCNGGWTAMNGNPAWGGQGLPWLVTTVVNEVVSSANMAFGLCPMLSQGAIELLELHADNSQKSLYLPRLNSGEWTATMGLTEPQAGSDLGRVRTRAVPENGNYRISGQKIFTTYGDHDLAENILHLVLARTPDSEPGTRGISLFIVPKILVDKDGKLGPRNDLRCVSLEHKLGIHASPTAVMSYGDDGGATGYLVGEENRGLEYMFTMMNTSRMAVGIEGVGIAELATQTARAYALERVQGRRADGDSGEAAAIIHHPDVRRMLLTMRVRTEACRAVALYTAACQDIAQRHPDPETSLAMQSRLDLLTPVVKAWSTDIGIEVANTAIQVHGGVGYIEETGVAQILRDGRITTIYEGTNGIQANDLVGRKIIRDEGRSLAALSANIRETINQLSGSGEPHDQCIAQRLAAGCESLDQTTTWLRDQYFEDRIAALAGAVDFLSMLGDLVGGWLMASAVHSARQRLDETSSNEVYLRRKIQSAVFYSESVLTVLPFRALKIQQAGPVTAEIAVEDV